MNFTPKMESFCTFFLTPFLELNLLLENNSVNKRICRCCASHFQACYDAINNFGKLGIKENLDEKLTQIGQIEVTPDCEKVLRTKISRKFFRKVTVLANGVKKSTTASIL